MIQRTAGQTVRRAGPQIVEWTTNPESRFFHHVQIYLSRSEIVVPHEVLNRSHVGAILPRKQATPDAAQRPG